MSVGLSAPVASSNTLAQVYEACNSHFAAVPGQVSLAVANDCISFLSHEISVFNGVLAGAMANVFVALEITAPDDDARPVASLQVKVRNPEEGTVEQFPICLVGDLESEVDRFIAEIVDLDGHDEFALLAEAAVRNRFDLFSKLAYAVDAEKTRSPARKALKTFNVSVFTEVRVAALEVKGESPQDAFATAGGLCFHNEVRGRSQQSNNGCITTAGEWTEGAPLAAVVDFVADGEVQYELSLTLDEHGHVELAKLKHLWHKLTDVAVNKADGILESFLHFRAGTHREDIWRWFEASNPSFSIAEMMSGASAKVEGPTVERRILLVDGTDLLGIHYRKIHPAQDIEILDMLANDHGVAPGFDYREDGQQALLFAEDELGMASDEQIDFIQRGQANMDYAGARWVTVIRTSIPGAEEVVAFASSDKDVVEAFCEKLKGGF